MRYLARCGDPRRAGVCVRDLAVGVAAVVDKTRGIAWWREGQERQDGDQVCMCVCVSKPIVVCGDMRYSCAYFDDEINKRNLHRIGSWIERSILNDAAPSYYLCAGTRVDRLYRNTTLAVGVRRIPK